MNSKTQFIQKSLSVALWIFPAFSSVFGMNMEENPQEYLNKIYAQSESLSQPNVSLQYSHTTSPKHRTSKGLCQLNKKSKTIFSKKNNRIDYILRLIDKMEKTKKEFIGLKLDYLLGNVTEKRILSHAYKKNISLKNKEFNG